MDHPRGHAPGPRGRALATGATGWPLQPAAPYLAAPSVFITDGRAISFAESVMGIVEAYRLGEIVGGPTAGTNGNVNPLRSPAATAWDGRGCAS